MRYQIEKKGNRKKGKKEKGAREMCSPRGEIVSRINTCRQNEKRGKI